MLRIVIGPNGHGKTTYLNQERDTLEKAGESVFFIPSEIKLLDEVKDTVDTSQTMEYLLTELLTTPDFIAKRDALFNEADSIIRDSLPTLNSILEDVLSLNGAARSSDFISPNKKRIIKNLVSINQDDIKKKMGSGQRMQLLLKLAANSNRKNIFLDEPEKYSHPSLLNSTALAINGLVAKGKNVYIATHSPKLISMIDVDYEDIYLINDSSHTLKKIPFDQAVADTAKLFKLGLMKAQNKRYYISGSSLSESIKKRHNRQFIEVLFSKRVYLCEGANDELLINAALQQFGGYFEDYAIFKVWGKVNLPVFAQLFSLLGIKVVALFDKDNEGKTFHKEANAAVRSLAGPVAILEQDPNIEEAVGYPGKKEDALGFMDYLESISIDPRFDLSTL